MRTPLIAGNWKMHMTRPQALGLIQGLKEQLRGETLSAEVLVAPPFTALQAVAEALEGSGWQLAAQNAFWEDQGAYTGEVSPPMLRELGCRFVILGHSERRQHFDETDETVRRRIQAVLRNDMTPILCVGESLPEREEGNTLEIVQRQLEGALGGFKDQETPEWVLAYEPVWAIGTGKTATPEQAQEVHLAIRQWMRERFSAERTDQTRILYGGSVKPSNVDELMAQPDIDGVLVGGASLQADSFARIAAFKRAAGS